MQFGTLAFAMHSTLLLLLCSQVHFSSIDLELHSRFAPGAGESVFDRDAAVAQKTQVRSVW
jgi:Zn-dependent oligopeptidase